MQQADGRAYLVSLLQHDWFRSRLSAMHMVCPCNPIVKQVDLCVPFWPEPVSLFGSLCILTFIDDSLVLIMPVSLVLFRAKLPELLRVSRRYLQPPRGVRYIVPQAPHPAITRDARWGRLRPTERTVHLIPFIEFPPEQLQQRLFESH